MESVRCNLIAFPERTEVEEISSLRRLRLIKFQEDCWYITIERGRSM